MKTATTSKFTLVFLFLIGCLLSLWMFKTLMIHSDNLQLMDKALRLIQQGEWTHFGNRSTKVGSIPGSFLTAITAWPMMIYFSPYSAMAVILLFHILSLFFLQKSARAITPHFPLVYLLLFFWLNPWRVEQSELYNPAYLFLFATIHLYTSLQMQHKNFWWSFWHILAIGFCFQVHFSFLILVFVSFLLWVSGQIKIHWPGVVAATLLILLSLSPYLYERFFLPSAIEQQIDLSHSDAFLGRNLILVYPVAKAIIYFFRMGSLYFGRHIFSEIQFEWIGSDTLRSIVYIAFHGLKWILAGISFFFAVKWMGVFFKNYRWKEKIRWQRSLETYAENRFKDYFIALFVALVLASALSPVEFNHWHLILCFPAISLMMSFFISKFVQNKSWQRPFLTAMVSIFVLWGIFASLGSRSHSFKNDYNRDWRQHYGIHR